LQAAGEGDDAGPGLIGFEEILAGFEISGGFFFIEVEETVGDAHEFFL
jgi:hypothetical protein